MSSLLLRLDPYLFHSASLSNVANHFEEINSKGFEPCEIISIDDFIDDESSTKTGFIKSQFFDLNDTCNLDQVSLTAYKAMRKLDDDQVKTCSTSRFFEFAGFEGHSLLLSDLREKFQGEEVGISQSGNFIYPANAGYMGWHTNWVPSESPVRIYAVYVPIGGRSFFRYVNEEGDMVTDWDEQGWNIRAFQCGGDHRRLWHCVYSDGTMRFSCGYSVFGIQMSDLSHFELK